MQRLKVVALLVGVLAVSLVGVAEASGGPIKTTSVTARVLPKHINPPSIATAHYAWNVHGNIVYPKRYCPKGANNPPYCTTVTKAVCTGKVKYAVKIGNDSLLASSGKTIGKGTAKITGSCAYKFKFKAKTALFIAKSALHNSSSIRHVGVLFYVTFPGNKFLSERSARRQTVIAKILEPGI